MGWTTQKPVNLPKNMKINFPSNVRTNVNLDDDSTRDNGSFGPSGEKLYRSAKTVYRPHGKEVLSFGSLRNKRNKKTFQGRVGR